MFDNMCETFPLDGDHQEIARHITDRRNITAVYQIPNGKKQNSPTPPRLSGHVHNICEEVKCIHTNHSEMKRNFSRDTVSD
jgi:hypothetical protein